MASESPAATMESVDGTTPSTVSSRRSAEARGRRLERERARRRQRLASETAAERERRLSQRRARDRARRAARSSPTSETRLVQMGSVERHVLLLAYEHMFMLNDLSFSEDCAG